MLTLRELCDIQYEETSKKIEECWQKVDKIKPTELVLREVHKTIDSKLKGIDTTIADLTSSVSARFLKLYQEELWEEGWFGPV